MFRRLSRLEPQILEAHVEGSPVLAEVASRPHTTELTPNPDGDGKRPTNEANDILDSWKEISIFLRRGIRTVQRWEATEGLPVHRHRHLKRGTVFAMASEIRNWLKTREYPANAGGETKGSA